MNPRTFPASWRVDTTAGGHFVIRDANEFPLAYVYAKTKPTVSGQELKPVDALMIAETIAKPPELLKRRRASESIGNL